MDFSDWLGQDSTGGGWNPETGTGGDIYGNVDMGSGITGTTMPYGGDPASIKAALDSSQPGLWDKLLQQVGNNPLQAAKLAGQLLSTGLGAYGANRQAGQLGALASQYTGFGAPSRARYETSMTPGFDPTSIPGYAGALDTTSKNVLARLSAQGGNPFGNPAGLVQANKDIVSGTALPAIQNYQALNANTGFGTSMQLGAGLQGQAIGADANTLNALGYGLNAITNPQPSLSDLIDQIQKSYKPTAGTGL
jgi:hypothetical protein